VRLNAVTTLCRDFRAGRNADFQFSRSCILLRTKEYPTADLQNLVRTNELFNVQHLTQRLLEKPGARVAELCRDV